MKWAQKEKRKKENMQFKQHGEGLKRKRERGVNGKRGMRCEHFIVQLRGQSGETLNIMCR